MTATNLVYIGIRGTVLALDRSTGAAAWQTPLKGSDFVNLVVDGDELMATTRGEVFCLDPSTGQIRWNNPLKGFGWGLATIAASGSTALPAMMQYRKQQEQSNSASAASM